MVGFHGLFTGYNDDIHRMRCCDVDIHIRRLPQICHQLCLSCNTQLDGNGFPYPATTVAMFIECRHNCRHTRVRNGVVV